jgi:hypothetical protein
VVSVISALLNQKSFSSASIAYSDVYDAGKIIGLLFFEFGGSGVNQSLRSTTRPDSNAVAMVLTSDWNRFPSPPLRDHTIYFWCDLCTSIGER